MLIFKKEKEVIELALEHMECVTKCVQCAVATFKGYLAGDVQEVQSGSTEVDSLETLADAKRREIGDLLFQGAYLPAIREDIFNVVDAADVVAGMAESLTDFLNDQRPDIPGDLHEDLNCMMDLTLEATVALQKTLRAFYETKGKVETVRERAQEVGKLESRIDELEMSVTRSIFSSALDIGHKVHLRNAVAHIVRISDRVEDAADKVELVSLKALV